MLKTDLPQILNWNQTKRVINKLDLVTLFKYQVQTRPHKLAVSYQGNRISYAKLDQLSDNIANHILKRFSLDELQGENIAFCFERSDLSIAVTLAILKLGASYVPFDTTHPDERLHYILKDSAAKLVIVDTEQQQRQQDCPELSLDEIDLETPTAALDPTLSEQNPIAYIMYTSGSTGQPKGVRVPKLGINRLVLNVDYLNITERSVFSQTGNIAFDAATLEIWSALLNGASLAVIPYETVIDSAALPLALQAQQVTDAFFTVALFNQLATENPNAFGLLENLFIGGDALNPKMIAAVMDAVTPPKKIWNCYGPTENTTMTTIHLIQRADCERISIPIGTPLHNTTCYVLDEQLNPVAIGEIGELYTSGLGLAAGYLNKPDKTAEAFIPNPFYMDPTLAAHTPATPIMYKTGDKVRWLTDGTLEFIGRVDNQVKIRGFRLELGEVENYLLQLPDIEQACVLAQSLNNEKQLVAYCVSTMTEAAIITQLRAKLPAHMIPSYIVLMVRFPITANGKVDKKALPPVDFSIQYSQGSPLVTDTERSIATIWQTILGITQPIAREAHFFDLGGHSLQAVKVQQQLAKQGYSIKIADLFRYPTLQDLATQLESHHPRSTHNLLEAAQRQQTIPATQQAGQAIPLSSEQRRLWLIDQAEGPSALYTIPTVFKISGELNVMALEQAFAYLIQRHDSLRVRIVEKEGQPYQQTIEYPFKLTPQDVEQLAQLDKIVNQASAEPFDLANEPLLRVKLYRCKTDYYLFINIHHIICDGWSMGNFYQELATLYQQRCNGSPCTLPPLAIQYTDYCLWLQQQDLSNDLNYWKKQLAEVKPLELPVDLTKPAGLQAKIKHLQLNALQRSRLEKLAMRHHTGLFNILYSAFAILLARYTQQQDIPIAGIWANRPYAELSQQIGFFANTIILRSTVNPECSIADFLQQNHHQLFTSFEHGAAPLEQVLQQLNIPRHSTQHPLCSVALVLQNTDGGAGKSLYLNQLTIDDYSLSAEPAKFDLMLNIVMTDEAGLQVMAHFRDGIWPLNLQNSLLDHYLQILTAIETEQGNLADIDLLTAAERHQHLVEFNRTTQLLDCVDLLVRFKLFVAQQPDNIAVSFNDRTLSYKELDQRSDKLAAGLCNKMGATQLASQHIVFAIERSDWEIVSMLAILKVGASYVPFDANHPDERLHYILSDCQAPLLITDRANQNRQSLCEEFYLEDIDYSDQSFSPNFATIAGNPIAYIMYTSGSTGQPKGVRVPKNAIKRLVINTDYIQITPNSVFAQAGNIAFDASTYEIWGALLNGARVAIMPYEVVIDSQAFPIALEQQGVTDAFLTVALFNQLAQENPNAFGHIQNLIVGGDALNPKCIAMVIDSDTPPKQLWNGYGPTENTTFTTLYRIQRQDCDAKSISIGKPIENTTCYILDPNKNPLPIGIAGELYTSGLGVAEGYLNKPDKTLESFIPNPFFADPVIRAATPATATLYKTGDKVRWRADGCLEFLGRMDNQVKIRGFRLELGEVENELLQLGEIEQVCVLAKEHHGEKKLVAYCVANGELAAILGHLHNRVPSYMIPSLFIFMDKFPLTHNGKVDKRQLPEPDFQHSAKKIITAHTPTEQTLVAIWEKLLDKPAQISIDDHFFDVGGHSLLVIQMIKEIYRALDYKFEIKAVFENPVLSQLAQLIDGKNHTTQTNDSEQCLADQWLHLAHPFISEPNIVMEKVLLTGATGFLGAYLLHEIQQQRPQAIIYCLVRADNLLVGSQRIWQACSKYGLAIRHDTIRIVCGDLKKKNLGIDLRQWECLTEQIDTIYHCGAWVNHLHSYTTMRDANVGSTLDLLQFCQKGRSKQFFFISTLSTVYDNFEHTIPEKTVASHPVMDNGYTQTKWVAERLMQQAFKEGLMGSVFRMGNITGCSKTGVSNYEHNHTLNLIKGCLQMEMAPKWQNYNLDISPIDILAKLVIQSGLQHAHHQQFVNMGYVTSIDWCHLFELFIQQGHPLHLVDPADWALKGVAHITEENALYPFKSFYEQPIEQAEIRLEHRYIEESKIKLDIEQLFNIYYQYWLETQFLTAALVEA